jgi:hypothetical protein
MPVDTKTEVEEIQNVQDQNGDKQAPTNEQRQKEIENSLGNHDGLTAEEYTTGSTDPEALPSHSVPDGVTVLVTYKPGNGSDVYVGDDSAQPVALTQVGQGVGFDVTDTADIYIQTVNAGDGVGLIFEGGA